MRIALPAGARLTVTTPTPETVVVPNSANVRLQVPVPGYNPDRMGATITRTPGGWKAEVQKRSTSGARSPWGAQVNREFTGLAEAIAWGIDEARRPG